MTDTPAAEIPVIETPRTILRGHRLSDFDSFVAMWTDPLHTRFITGQPLPREEVWARLLRYRGHWQLLDYGYWVVEEKGTGRFLGGAGFQDAKREMEPSIEGLPEAGWGFVSAVHGQGFATEVVGAMHEWGDAHFGKARTVCIIDPENLASIRIAEKNGYREAVRTTYKGAPTLLFERG